MPTNTLALTRLLLTERPSLMRLVQRIVGNAPGAEDVAQSLWFRIQRVEDEPPIANHRAYLFRLASNLAVDHRRSEARASAVQAEAAALLNDEETDFSPERIVESAETLWRVKCAAERLPEPTRSIFRMNRYENVPQREIAVRVGLSATSVENHIKRALAILAQARDGSSEPD